MENRLSDIDWMPDEARGIVVLDGSHQDPRPAIAAFVWGGKVRPVPTLPFGRWKTAAS